MLLDGIFWAFLALAVPLYWVIPARARSAALLAASLLFLAWHVPVHVAVVLLVAMGVRRAAAATRPTVSLLVAGLIAYLACLKYAPPADWITGGAAPLGVSYVTFKLIHYVIDRRRGALEEPSWVDYLLWVFFVPIFPAGPIERIEHFVGEREERWSRDSLVEGLTRVIYGLIKLFVINRLVVLQVSRRFFEAENPADFVEVLPTVGTGAAWGFVVCRYLFVYLDFSAYTDLAIGTSRLFGFRILENFRWPVLATSIGDFWKRWHMTLSGWCQRYVYLSVLARSRQPYLAILATFLVMGLWHGVSWNWVLWGLYHSVGVGLFVTWQKWKRERLGNRPTTMPGRVAGWAATFAFVAGAQAATIPAGMDDSIGISLRIFGRLLGIG